jgi:hypothetical protein
MKQPATGWSRALFCSTGRNARRCGFLKRVALQAFVFTHVVIAKPCTLLRGMLYRQA